MKVATFERRCRRCGGVSDGRQLEITSSWDYQKIAAVFESAEGNGTSGMHECSDGGYGVTDLIGCRMSGDSTQGEDDG